MVLAGDWEGAQVLAKQHYRGWDFGQPMVQDDEDEAGDPGASSSAGGKGGQGDKGDKGTKGAKGSKAEDVYERESDAAGANPKKRPYEQAGQVGGSKKGKGGKRA